MLGDSTRETKIEDHHERTDRDPNEPEDNGNNVEFFVHQQSYGEPSITNDSDNVMKSRDQGIKKHVKYSNNKREL